MELKQQKSKKVELKSKSLFIGAIIATLIAITPYIFYLHESVPDIKVWNTFLFDYNSGHYGSASIAVWVILGKITPLYLLLIWFFTCRHWWYHSLLVPIAMYSYQTIDVINKDVTNFDTNQLVFLIPLMALTIPSIYLIRAKIFNKVNETNKSMQQLEDELKFKPRNLWGKITQYF